MRMQCVIEHLKCTFQYVCMLKSESQSS